ncbi:MAG: flagellar hook-length control protein FliK [Gammaproteobacteria bacterium]
MQSLISQISHLFATQSLNTLENSGLQYGASTITDFGGLLEGFSGGDYTAEIATLNGNLLQPSPAPISFQLTQFALTAQPGASDGSVEYSGEITHARIESDLLDLTGIRQNTNANTQSDVNSFTADNYTNLTSLSSQTLTVDSMRAASSLSTDSIGSNVGPITTLNNFANESVIKSHLSSLNQQTVNIQDENLINSRQSLAAPVETSLKTDVLQNNINIFTKENDIRSNANSNLLNSTTIDDVIVNNITSTNKSPDQTLSAYSVASIDDKATKNPKNLNILSVDNKISVSNESHIVDSRIPGSKVNLTDDSINVSEKSDIRPLATDLNRINSSALNNQNVPNENAAVSELPKDELEVNAVKQTYNPLQQDEIKRVESNARDEIVNIRSHGLDQNTFSDNGRATNRNEFGVDLTSSIKNQEFVQDVKFTPNNIAIDKANIHSPASPEPLSTNNRLSGLDKPLLQLNSNNEVGNGDDLAQQIAWAKNTNTNNIKIAISPEHLGALEINIESDKDGLNIQFLTQNSTAKEALETFMPRLKDMLEQDGLNLQNANVSQQDKGQSDNAEYENAEQFVSQSDTNDQFNPNSASEANTSSAQSNNRLLEAFA